MAQQKNNSGNRTGQSIIEYIVMITAVVVALILFLGKGSVFEKSFNEVIKTQGEDITTMGDKIFN